MLPEPPRHHHYSDQIGTHIQPKPQDQSFFFFFHKNKALGHCVCVCERERERDPIIMMPPHPPSNNIITTVLKVLLMGLAFFITQGEAAIEVKGTIPTTALIASVVATPENYIYFGADNIPVIIKVDGGTGSSPPTIVTNLTLVNITAPSNAGKLAAGAYDSVTGYLYFLTNANPTQIVKLSPGSGASPPKQLNTTNLPVTLARGAVIDLATGYMYVCFFKSPGVVGKIDIRNSTGIPNWINQTTFNFGENGPVAGAIDPVNGYTYWSLNPGGASTIPPRVIKVYNGLGANPPVKVETLVLTSNQKSLVSLVYYSGMVFVVSPDTNIGTVSKINVGDGSKPMQQVWNTTKFAGPGNTLAVGLYGTVYLGDGTSGSVTEIYPGENATALPSIVSSVKTGIPGMNAAAQQVRGEVGQPIIRIVIARDCRGL